VVVYECSGNMTSLSSLYLFSISIPLSGNHPLVLFAHSHTLTGSFALLWNSHSHILCICCHGYKLVAPSMGSPRQLTPAAAVGPW